MILITTVFKLRAPGMSLNRIPLFVWGMLVTAFALLTIDYHSNGSTSPLHPLEKAIGALVGPGEKAVASLVRPLGDEVHFGRQPSKVAELQKELDAARSLAETSQDDHRRVLALDKLLGWPPYYVDTMKPARVVGNGDTLAGGNSVTIDTGTRDGLHVNMTVVTGLGLIGNIVAVNRDTATVQLLTDPAIHVGVRNGRTNTTGIISGGANGTLDLTQINQVSDIRVGDQLITLGSRDNAPYLADVPVGKVVKVDTNPGSATHTAVVRPYASFIGLDDVAVIFAPATPAKRRFFIAPITPTPTTSASPSPATTPVLPLSGVGPSASALSTRPASPTQPTATAPPPATP